MDETTDDLASELAEIIRLHPDRDLEDDDAPIARVPSAGHCLHRRVNLDTTAHRVLCRDCDREVDPFAVLVRLTGDWEHFARFRKESQRKAEEAHTRLKELIRLESNARARLRRIDPKAEKTVDRPWGAGSVF